MIHASVECKHFFFQTSLSLELSLASCMCYFFQQVLLVSWCSHKQTLEWTLRWWQHVQVCMWRGHLSPELYLTSHSPLLHTPCQQVGPYLSPTELSHWVHTWPCHYLVPGFVSTLLSPFCVFPDFPFPHYLNKDKNRVYLHSAIRHTHSHSLSLFSFSPLLFMKEALCLLQREALTMTFHGGLRCSQHL